MDRLAQVVHGLARSGVLAQKLVELPSLLQSSLRGGLPDLCDKDQGRCYAACDKASEIADGKHREELSVLEGIGRVWADIAHADVSGWSGWWP